MKLLTLLLALSSAALAGFLPFVHERPKRDNPHDPRVRPLELPAVALPTLTFTPTLPPSCGGPELANYAGFESGVDAFSALVAGGFTAPPLAAGTPACQGGQALCGTANWVYGGNPVKVAFTRTVASADWSGRNLAAKAYLPAGLSGTCAKLYLKLGAAYAYAQGACVNALPAGGWIDLSLDVNAAASAVSASPADVREVGVEFYSDAAGNSDGSRTVCLDSLFLLGGPTPTITPTYSASPSHSPTAFGSFTHTPTSSPTRTPTPTALPTCGAPTDASSVASFESGAEAWSAETYSGYTYMTVTASTPACLGAQALCGAANLAHGGTLHLAFKKGLTPSDWSGKGLEARVYAPAGYGASTAALYVKVGAGYTGRQGPLVALPAGGGYSTLSMNLAALAPAEQADVREVGVDLFSAAGDPDGPVSYCIDAVTLR